MSNMLCFLGSFNNRIGFNFEILFVGELDISQPENLTDRDYFFVGELGKSKSANPTVEQQGFMLYISIISDHL